LNKKIPLLILILVSATAASAYAASLFILTKPATVCVYVDFGIELYSDAACTIPVSSVKFTDIQPGQAVNSSIYYVKNTGKSYIHVRAVFRDVPLTLTVKAYGNNLKPLCTDPLDVDWFVMTGTAYLTSITGGYAKALMFEASAGSACLAGDYGFSIELQSFTS